MPARPKLHTLSLLHLHQLTNARCWALWTHPSGRGEYLRSPRGALYRLTIAPIRAPGPRYATFHAQQCLPDPRHPVED